MILKNRAHYKKTSYSTIGQGNEMEYSYLEKRQDFYFKSPSTQESSEVVFHKKMKFSTNNEATIQNKENGTLAQTISSLYKEQNYTDDFRYYDYIIRYNHNKNGHPNPVLIKNNKNKEFNRFDTFLSNMTEKKQIFLEIFYLLIDNMVLNQEEQNLVCYLGMSKRSKVIIDEIDNAYLELLNQLNKRFGEKDFNDFKEKELEYIDGDKKNINLKGAVIYVFYLRKAILVINYFFSQSPYREKYINNEQKNLKINKKFYRKPLSLDPELTSGDEDSKNYFLRMGESREFVISYVKQSFYQTIQGHNPSVDDIINLRPNAIISAVANIKQERGIKVLLANASVSAMPIEMVEALKIKTEMYLGRKIDVNFSPCSGWGAPVYVGANNHIVAVNPHKDALDGTMAGINALKKGNKISKTVRTDFINKPIEKVTEEELNELGLINNVDFSFICPPYFRQEIYEPLNNDNNNQSINLAKLANKNTHSSEKNKFITEYRLWLDMYVKATANAYALTLKNNGDGVAWVVLPYFIKAHNSLTREYTPLARDFIEVFTTHGLVPFCSKKINKDQIAVAFSKGQAPKHHLGHHNKVINSMMESSNGLPTNVKVFCNKMPTKINAPKI